MLRNNKLNVTLVIAIILVLSISLAYAAMSTTLNVTVNRVTQNALTWNVALVTGSVSATVGGTSTTGRSCGTATVTATAVTVANTILSKPDDSCTYKFQVRNSGGINAKLGTITPTNPTGTGVSCGISSGGTMECGNITYKITTDSTGNTEATSSNTSVLAGSTKDLYLVVKFTGSTPSSSSVVQSNAKFALPFEQN